MSAVVLALTFGSGEVARFAERLGGLGGPGAIAMAVLFAALAALGVPGLVLAAAAVRVFGLALGFAVTYAGGLAGATAAFFLARSLGRDAAAEVVARHPRAHEADAALAERGGWAVLALRVLPVLPFNALNYLCGLTAVRWRSYVLATAVGMLPGTWVYCWALAGVVPGSEEVFAAGRIGLWIAGAFLAAIALARYLLLRHRGRR